MPLLPVGTRTYHTAVIAAASAVYIHARRQIEVIEEREFLPHTRLEVQVVVSVKALAQAVERHNIRIHQFLLDCFTQFFVRNVKNYHRDDLPIHFVGSIAVVYEAELRAAAISLGLIVGRIIKAPLEGLIMYHHPDNHP